MTWRRLIAIGCLGTAVLCAGRTAPTGVPRPATGPPTIRPFGPRQATRRDAVPGYVELSDRSIHPGAVYLTRGARLKIHDRVSGRVREIPLRVVRRIECGIRRQWFEKEWRFKENANNEKLYTGRAYPVREYVHTVMLRDGRKIVGPLSSIIYVRREADGRSERFLLHKRDKGPLGGKLESMVYVRKVELGNEALKAGKRQAPRRNGVPHGTP